MKRGLRSRYPIELDPLVGRLLKGGAGAFIASIALLMLPTVGAFFLEPSDYVLWALLATVITAAMVLDFGGGALVQHAVAAGVVTRKILLRAIALAAFGSLSVGVPATLLWEPVSSRLLAPTESAPIALILVSTVGSAMRSAIVVVAAKLLAERRFRRRAFVLIGQAVSQVLSTVVLLLLDTGLWALPLGLTLSTGPWLIACLFEALRNLPYDHPSARYISTGLFATSRGASAVISLVMTQGDRWILALVANAELIQAYDLAARFALMPKAVVTTFLVGLVGEGVHLKGAAAGALLNRAISIAGRALGVLSALAVAGAFLVGYLVEGRLSATYISIALAIVAWSAIHGLTAPVTLILTGRGRPDLELRYLIPCLVSTFAVWLAGYRLAEPYVLIFGSGLALVVWSIYCLVSSARLLTISESPSSTSAGGD